MEDPGFPRGDANSKDWGCLRIIWPIIFQNCMKMKEIGLRGGTPQWQIQDFPEGGANPEFWAKTYHLARFLPKTALKWKQLDRQGACVPSAPWIRQCTSLPPVFGSVNGGVVPSLFVGKKLTLENNECLITKVQTWVKKKKHASTTNLWNTFGNLRDPCCILGVLGTWTPAQSKILIFMQFSTKIMPKWNFFP